MVFHSQTFIANYTIFLQTGLHLRVCSSAHQKESLQLLLVDPSGNCQSESLIFRVFYFELEIEIYLFKLIQINALMWRYELYSKLKSLSLNLIAQKYCFSCESVFTKVYCKLKPYCWKYCFSCMLSSTYFHCFMDWPRSPLLPPSGKKLFKIRKKSFVV
jgi:hypothetical protein